MGKLDQYCFDGINALSLKKTADRQQKRSKLTRKKFLSKQKKIRKKNFALQDKLYADAKEGLIIILQARDAAGKDSTIRHVMGGINPQGVQVFSYKQPSKDELAHDYLWRCVTNLPKRGMIAIFNRSYYEDVLVVKVHELYKGYHMAERCSKSRYNH